MVYTKSFIEEEIYKIKELLQGWIIHKNPGIPKNREIIKEMHSRYPGLFKDSGEMQYWFQADINAILNLAFCSCGNKKSWIHRSYSTKYCSNKCYMKYEGVGYLKNLNLEKYGVVSSNYRLDVREKIKQSVIKQYKNNKETINNKRKLTCLGKYGTNFPTSCLKISKKISEVQLNRPKDIKRKIQDKVNQTKKLHNSFNSSKPEKNINQLLLKKYPNTISQYRDSRYPYNCDFYIPSLDVFIEYQGTWLHGFHPFDKNNLEDINILNIWKEKSDKYQGKKNLYKAAIYTWTDLDVRKRETAKRNNLNYLEFFSETEFMEWYNKQ